MGIVEAAEIVLEIGQREHSHRRIHRAAREAADEGGDRGRSTGDAARAAGDLADVDTGKCGKETHGISPHPVNRERMTAGMRLPGIKTKHLASALI